MTRGPLSGPSPCGRGGSGPGLLAPTLLLGFAVRKVGRNAFAGKTTPAPVLPTGAVAEEVT
ncbi:hypothetical protein FW320_30480 [Azospirillum sp. Vi22]|nr:hypothetical protein [Azospirillum baldaniorum]